MIRLQTLSPITVRRNISIIGVILCLVAVAATGCATQGQVIEIVNQSNELMLISMIDMNSSVLPGAGLPSGNPDSPGIEPWEEASGKIDAFIATHSDQKTLVSALRIRQGMLLLAHGEYNLARAAFEMADPVHLRTARDTALYNLREHLIWWFEQDKTIVTTDNFKKGEIALVKFQEEIDKIGESPGIRDYLAEMRAYIALQMALRMTAENKATEYFEDGINKYAMIFTNADLNVLKAYKGVLGSGRHEVTLETRRQIRGLIVIKKAKDVIKTQSIKPDIKNEIFRSLILGQAS
ncbi:MAG: hypothetical protein U9N83_03120 [Thermodesulfobacteriota bacterium]|nr:hypothetical protein [Thermodesulfobacteriota bacterium]